MGPELPAKLCFYRELPYRVNYPDIANVRFAHIENTIGRLRLIEQAFPIEPKLAVGQLYGSQITADAGLDDVLVAKLLSRERIWELVR